MKKFKEPASQRLLKEQKGRVQYKDLLINYPRSNYCPSGSKNCKRTKDGGVTCYNKNGRQYFVKGFSKCPFNQEA